MIHWSVLDNERQAALPRLRFAQAQHFYLAGGTASPNAGSPPRDPAVPRPQFSAEAQVTQGPFQETLREGRGSWPMWPTSDA